VPGTTPVPAVMRNKIPDWLPTGRNPRCLQRDCSAIPAMAKRPSISTCERCHKSQAKQFREGKHALCEVALTTGNMAKKMGKKVPDIVEKSCAVCHLTMGENGGQCDACHTRHRSIRNLRRDKQYV
jgi:hypothetical protein